MNFQYAAALAQTMTLPAAMVTALFVADAAHAQSTWSSDWSVAGNWTSGVPGPTEAAIFDENSVGQAPAVSSPSQLGGVSITSDYPLATVSVDQELAVSGDLDVQIESTRPVTLLAVD